MPASPVSRLGAKPRAHQGRLASPCLRRSACPPHKALVGGASRRQAKPLDLHSLSTAAAFAQEGHRVSASPCLPRRCLASGRSHGLIKAGLPRRSFSVGGSPHLRACPEPYVVQGPRVFLSLRFTSSQAWSIFGQFLTKAIAFNEQIES